MRTIGEPVKTLSLAEGQEAALEVLERYLPEPEHEGTVLSGRNISKSFGGIQALRDVPLIEVQAGQFVGLIGPNGAGKSTLFDVLNGFTIPNTGEVFFLGRNVTRMQPWDRAKLGMSRTFQANHIDLNQSTFDNLMAGAHPTIRGGLLAGTFRGRHNWFDERRAQAAAAATVRLLDLEVVAEVMAGSLDFAAQRRIEIGRSIMSGPKLLLLDEPTAGLDAHDARALIALMKRLQLDLGLDVLLIEHYVEAVLKNCNPVYVLAQGSLIAVGSPQEVASSPQVRSCYLGRKGHA